MRNELLIIIFSIVFAGIFLFFAPNFMITSDEWVYLEQANLIAQEKIGASTQIAPTFVQGPAGFISMYPIGNSLWLIPFLTAPFLSGLVAILLGTFFFYLILNRLKMDTKYTLLYLFCPTLIWMSRGLLAETMLATLVLIAFYFYIGKMKKEWIMAGAFFGLACLFKYPMFLLFGAFALVCLLKRDWEKLRWMSVGFAPFAVGILILNMILYGGAFTTGYALAGYGYLDLSLILSQLPYFVGLLMIIYPGLILAPFFFKNKFKWEIVFALVAFLLFFSAFFYSGPTGRLTDLLIKPRYYIPILGLLLLTYIPFFKLVLKWIKMSERFVFPFIVGVLIVSMAWMSSVHYDYTNSRYQVYQQVQEHVPRGSTVLGSLDDYIYSDHQRYLDVNDPRIENYVNVTPIYIIELYYSNRASYSDKTTLSRLNERQKARDLAIKYNAEYGFQYSDPHDLIIWYVGVPDENPYN